MQHFRAHAHHAAVHRLHRVGDDVAQRKAERVGIDLRLRQAAREKVLGADERAAQHAVDRRPAPAARCDTRRERAGRDGRKACRAGRASPRARCSARSISLSRTATAFCGPFRLRAMLRLPSALVSTWSRSRAMLSVTLADAAPRLARCERLGHPVFLAQVAAHQHDRLGAPGGVGQRDQPRLQIGPAAVGTARAEGRLAGLRRAQRLVERRLGLGAVVGMDFGKQMRAGGMVRRRREQPRVGRVVPDAAALRVGHGQRIGHMLGHDLEKAALALPRRLGPRPLHEAVAGFLQLRLQFVEFGRQRRQLRVGRRSRPSGARGAGTAADCPAWRGSARRWAKVRGA